MSDLRRWTTALDTGSVIGTGTIIGEPGMGIVIGPGYGNHAGRNICTIGIRTADLLRTGRGTGMADIHRPRTGHRMGTIGVGKPRLRTHV